MLGRTLCSSLRTAARSSRVLGCERACPTRNDGRFTVSHRDGRLLSRSRHGHGDAHALPPLGRRQKLARAGDGHAEPRPPHESRQRRRSVEFVHDVARKHSVLGDDQPCRPSSRTRVLPCPTLERSPGRQDPSDATCAIRRPYHGRDHVGGRPPAGGDARRDQHARRQARTWAVTLISVLDPPRRKGGRPRTDAALHRPQDTTTECGILWRIGHVQECRLVATDGNPRQDRMNLVEQRRVAEDQGGGRRLPTNSVHKHGHRVLEAGVDEGSRQRPAEITTRSARSTVGAPPPRQRIARGYHDDHGRRPPQQDDRVLEHDMGARAPRRDAGPQPRQRTKHRVRGQEHVGSKGQYVQGQARTDCGHCQRRSFLRDQPRDDVQRMRARPRHEM